MKLTSVMYHDVVRNGDYEQSGFPGAGANRYKLEQAEFDRHLGAMGEAGYRAALLPEGGAPGHFVITFDDGGAGAMWAADSLDARGFKGYFFVSTAYLNQAAFLSSEQLRELHARGHVIGSHSATHPHRISSLASDAIAAEWHDSVQALQDILGDPVSTASVPGGYYSHEVARLAREAGITHLWNSEPELRVRRVAGIDVMGRYTVLCDTAATEARALVTGEGRVRLRQFATWNARKALKKVASPVYDRLRARLIREPGA